MSRSVRPFRAGISVALLVTALATSSLGIVTAHTPDPVLSDTYWAQDQALTFDWRSGAVPPAGLKTAIKAAANDVNTTRGSRAATFTWRDGGANPIGYGLGATCGSGGLACFTRNVPNTFALWFREQGHRFDWGSLDWCQADNVPGNGCFDVETIALDEFGHTEGLDHHVNLADGSDFADAVVQTVSRAKPDAGWNQHQFGICDVATLQREYDVPGTSAPVSLCLDLDTTLVLSGAPTSALAGSVFTLTASLKVADVAAYHRLRGNPLTGRSVLLQRRSPGVTVWSAVGTMTAGAGSGIYTYGQAVWSGWEYRAVFKTSTTEGLNASTSGTVAVRIVTCASPPCPLLGGPSASATTVQPR